MVFEMLRVPYLRSCLASRKSGFTLLGAGVKNAGGVFCSRNLTTRYNTHWKKFLTMNRDHLSTSPEVLEIGEGWTYERFTVVYVNGWQVALHNPRLG